MFVWLLVFGIRAGIANHGVPVAIPSFFANVGGARAGGPLYPTIALCIRGRLCVAPGIFLRQSIAASLAAQF
jgi:hypothetical protein